MITGTLDTKQLFASLNETWIEFANLVCAVDEEKFNAVPFKDCWTVAQLSTHVKKSNNAIIQGLQMQGKPSGRNGDEGVENLKKIFLDFETKYQSPDFIVPEIKLYNKQDVIYQLETSIEKLKQLRSEVDINEMISLPAFGEITKYELLNFVLVHTQRHIHQLKKITSILSHN